MNASACATTDNQIQWSQIDWDKCNDIVRKLQVRIVKAQQEGRFGKVKSLQWLLTHSFSAKVVAVKRVTGNKGKNTPGVDNQLWKSDKDKVKAAKSLVRKGYKAKPLRRVYIPKKNSTKKRGLGIPTMRDRAMQALYLMALDPVAETICDNNSYGFRKARSTADAIEAVFKILSTKASAKWVLEGDIKSCFDAISHEWLMTNVSIDKKILSQWLKSGIIFRNELYDTKAGTPQGGVISACLSRLALNGLEERLRRKFNRRTVNGEYIRLKVNIVIYADDFIITGISKTLLENEVMPEIISFMKERDLELSPEKTLITHIDEGFDFLGTNVRKYNDKLLTKPSKANVKAFLRNIHDVIKGNSTAKQESLIEMLNPKIRGWSNYHRHNVAKETFTYVDAQIFKYLWKWACRRHNDKSKKWIKNKYFHTISNRQWVFATKTKTATTRLKIASDTKIIRHLKIRGDANPYSKEWEPYFEEREGNRLFESMNGRSKLVKMWISQNGLCPICGIKVTKETGWRMHIVDVTKVKSIVHPKCHEIMHGHIHKPVELVLS